jgi:acyl-CoA synthetase (AMP-forming)/AMP-acid ligase II
MEENRDSLSSLLWDAFGKYEDRVAVEYYSKKKTNSCSYDELRQRSRKVTEFLKLHNDGAFIAVYSDHSVLFTSSIIG